MKMRVIRKEQADATQNTVEERGLETTRRINELNAAIARGQELIARCDAEQAAQQTPQAATAPKPRNDAALMVCDVEQIARIAKVDVKDVQTARSGLALPGNLTDRIKAASLIAAEGHIDGYCAAMRAQGKNQLQIQAERQRLQAQFFGS
jgi:hypothetical protein